jgi:hypothetical protein
MGPRLTPDGHDTWGGRQPPTTVGHQPSCQVGGCGSGMPVTAATSRHVSPNPEQPQVEVFDQPGQHRRFVGFQQERLGIAVLGGGERVQVRVRVLCEAVIHRLRVRLPLPRRQPRHVVLWTTPWITLRAASSRRPSSAPAGRPGGSPTNPDVQAAAPVRSHRCPVRFRGCPVRSGPRHGVRSPAVAADDQAVQRSACGVRSGSGRHAPMGAPHPA